MLAAELEAVLHNRDAMGAAVPFPQQHCSSFESRSRQYFEWSSLVGPASDLPQQAASRWFDAAKGQLLYSVGQNPKQERAIEPLRSLGCEQLPPALVQLPGAERWQ